MSSFFEGQYRRAPEQNLSGSSCVESRDQFLRRAQAERRMREDQRRRLLCAVKIQAAVRSYLIRRGVKHTQRREFLQLLTEATRQGGAESGVLSLDMLSQLTRKLLFFYHADSDDSYLITVSKMLLDKQVQSALMFACFSAGDLAWQLRLRKLLLLNLQLVSQRSADRDFNHAVSLRLLEVYISRVDSIRAILTDDGRGRTTTTPEVIVAHFTKLMRYLLQRGYFSHLRALLDSKVPPLLEATPTPPTPLASALITLLYSPFSLVPSSDPSLNAFVIEEFTRHFIMPPLTDPIKLFVFPALGPSGGFPYEAFVTTVHANMQQSLRASSGDPRGGSSSSGGGGGDWWLNNSHILYAALTLGHGHAQLRNEQAGLALVSAHLSVVALSSGRLVWLARADEDGEEGERGEDSRDMDQGGEGRLSRAEESLLEECCQILNEEAWVRSVLSTVTKFYHDPSVLTPLCTLCHHLLMSHKLACHRFRLLHMLALNHGFLRHLYSLTTSLQQRSLFNSSSTPLVSVIARGSPISAAETRSIQPLLATFASLFTLVVTTLHDSEFYGEAADASMSVDETGVDSTAHASLRESKMPFSLAELVAMTSQLKNVVLGLIELAYPDSRVQDVATRGAAGSNSHWSHVFSSLVSLLRSLHSRDARRRFTPGDAHWSCAQLSSLLGASGYDSPAGLSLRSRDRGGASLRPFHGVPVLTRDELDEGPPLTTRELRTLTILQEVPFLVSFPSRVLVWSRLIARDKASTYQTRAAYLQGPQIQISVRRNYLYEDAFDKLSPENEPELRHVMRVQLVNAVGLDEAGIDGGGVFREFLSQLLKTAFDPSLGFFRLTEDNLLYPNPGVALIHPDYRKHYYFIGRMLGKALYENLLVEIPLADLFLSKLVSRHSDVDIHHLATLDALLYRNLLSLKHLDDVEELGLDFTVLCDELGERRIIELKPSGAQIPVTNSNRIEYIHLVADYYLNRRTRAQCAVFKEGLCAVVAPEWLRMFNSRELGTLVSGAQGRVDLEDLRAHTAYLGGYTSEHETIQMLWEVVEEFSDPERRALLKFVTSCSRPPLLGFKELDPPFGIQLINSEDRLPSASTCMNLLKLPKFQTKATLRDKLRYAISSDCGFELS